MEPITRPSALTRRRALQLGASTAGLAAVGLLSCSGDTRSDTQDRIENPDDNINPTGMPIVKEKITLTMMTRRYPPSLDDWNDVASMRQMEQESNIHVDWGPIPWENASERRNLALASGDYPEILHRTGLSAVDLAKYGEQGTFIAWNDLIEQYMPNLSGLLAQNPDIVKGMTFPDGNIYSPPTIYDPDFESLVMQNQLCIRTDWLDDLGMAQPTTLDEFEAYLEAVRDGDPMGDGTGEQIPYSASDENLAIEMFHGTFGVATKGRSSGNLDTDEAGEIRFWPGSEAYRDLMEFVHRLYDHELIQIDIFNNDATAINNLGKLGVLGAVATQSTSVFFGKEFGDRFVALPPLKKQSSDPVPPWHSVTSSLAGLGQFVITDKAEHPIEAARWMDHFFGDDGARLFFMGVEGESYERTSDGGYQFLSKITDNPEGLTLGEALRSYVTYGGGSYPGIVTEEYFQGTESTPQAREATAVVAPHRLDEVWPSFTYSAEEATELSSLTVDIDKLVTESRAKFITGELAIADWDQYVGQLDQVGLSRYMEIQQAAYERYQA